MTLDAMNEKHGCTWHLSFMAVLYCSLYDGKQIRCDKQLTNADVCHMNAITLGNIRLLKCKLFATSNMGEQYEPF